MKKLRALIPHTSVLIANMYYVFYGIDRVNKSMNFIDNGITKWLLAIMCCLDAAVLVRFMKLRRRKKRLNLRRAANFAAEGLMAIFACIYLVIFVFDLIAGETMIMKNESAKAIALALCLTTTINSVRLIAAQRKLALRRRKKRR